MENNKKQYYTVKEVANLLNISRVAVFNKIKKGEIKAEKIGRNYAIHKTDLPFILGEELDEETKKEISDSVSRVVKEYGEALKMLSKS